MNSSYEFLPGEWSILDPYAKVVIKLYVTFYIPSLIYSSKWFNEYKLIEKKTEA